jgi:hypothetical protein
MFRYGLIVKFDFLHAEFDLGGFDLYAGLCTTAQEGFIQVIEFFKRICPSGYFITIARKLVPEGLRTTIRVQKTLPIFVKQTFL